jgi:hypothetical protein
MFNLQQWLPTLASKAPKIQMQISGAGVLKDEQLL